MIFDLPILTTLIWLPILGGCLLLALSRKNPTNDALIKWAALLLSVLTLLVCIPLYTAFDPANANMQLLEDSPWIPQFNVRYFLGVDGISVPLIMLTCFCTVIVVLAGWEVIKTRVAQYYAAFLLLTGFMNGVFAALDGILFYVFWEAMLVPMFLIIGIWGGPNRIYATIKFFLYTFLGSVLMLVALIYLYLQSNSFSILDFQQLPLAIEPQIFIFIAFFLAFAVKVPMWPVHTWLPDAHVEAPTGGSIILAAVMLKVGGYGFLRFSLPIVPDAAMQLDKIVIALSLIAVVYIAFVALVQKDMKKLIAYSSIAHMGFVTLGIFLIYSIVRQGHSPQDALMGVEGAMVQMISHGFISAALFFGVGVLYDRLHSRQIADYGGVASKMPVFAAFFMLFAMANAGLPGTSGFVGEFLVILASLKANVWYAVLAGTIMILGAAYTLWMYKRVMFGQVVHAGVDQLQDVNAREWFILVLLAITVLALGIYPKPLLDLMHGSLSLWVEQVTQSKLL